MIRLLTKLKRKYFIYFFGVVILLSVNASSVLGHGPKNHSGGNFTAFQAIKKGVGLYDKLVVSGKLDESWETDLLNIEVSTRGDGSKKEFVVKFIRSISNPRNVFIFFSDNGKYIGSNFTGK